MSRTWDAVIVGGGPAGLSAALWLARYRRRVITLDEGHPRNEAAWAVHGYPGLPDPDPERLRSTIREQATAAGAIFERRRVVEITGEKGDFTLADAAADTIGARRIVLAYGRRDRLPGIPGLEACYGRSVFHCPDCDGPTVEGARVAVLGHDRNAAALALYLLTWAREALMLTNGLDPALPPDAIGTLRRHSVGIITGRVERLESEGCQLRAARVDGRVVPLDALFFHWGSEPASGLGSVTGCTVNRHGDLEVNGSLETSIPGIYAAGDIIGRPHLAVSAAAGGVRAALALHRSLLPDEFRL
ncbi:MAG: NAD(P)/FAD-dependent oxidoreductase [Gemmatimonadota bacterium]